MTRSPKLPAEDRDPEEVAICTLLLGNDDQNEEGTIRLLEYEPLRTRTIEAVRKKYFSLDAWQLTEIWEKTVLAVQKNACKTDNERFRGDRPLSPYLASIAKRRAADLLRRLHGRRRRPKPHADDDAHPPGDADPSALLPPRPKVLPRGDQLPEPSDYRWQQEIRGQQLLEAVQSFARSLPRAQQRALLALADCWPDDDPDMLTRRVRQEDPSATRKSVTRALAEALEKLRPWLVRLYPDWQPLLIAFLERREQRRLRRAANGEHPDPEDVPDLPAEPGSGSAATDESAKEPSHRTDCEGNRHE